jgi:hypothetical protein
MMPTPAPGSMAPVVCASTIERVYAAQRALYRGPYADRYALDVIRDGSFALVSWGIGEEGGQSVYRYADGRWCRVANGGGIMGEPYLAEVVGDVRARRMWARWTRSTPR